MLFFAFNMSPVVCYHFSFLVWCFCLNLWACLVKCVFFVNSLMMRCFHGNVSSFPWVIFSSRIHIFKSVFYLQWFLSLFSSHFFPNILSTIYLHSPQAGIVFLFHLYVIHAKEHNWGPRSASEVWPDRTWMNTLWFPPPHCTSIVVFAITSGSLFGFGEK